MDQSLVAAVDLGSNSFRLQIARAEGSHIYPLDSLRESVRLAAGLQADKTLSPEVQDRALMALARFGERLQGFKAEDVRAVATNTLRVAHDSQDFLKALGAALGFPIEVISGKEEARLIYIGASHTLPPFSGRRLVVDIGGGSTEFIIGRQLTPLVLESLRLGCVSFTQQYFPEGRCDKKRFREAEIAAAREIETLVEEYTRFGWDEAIGTSGTARALAEILTENGFNPGGSTGITLQGLEELKAAMVRAGSAEALRLSGLRTDRVGVLAGGLSIMLAIFQTLGIQHMAYADGALRLGVLYDLRGRRSHEQDQRDETVTQMQARYQVSIAQAARVEALSLSLFEQISSDQDQETRLALAWAARLHEIGWAVAHASYHKHGAYILANADMPGFSRQEQERLAHLVLGHRGKLSKLAKLPAIEHLWPSLMALRLATLLNRARAHGQVPDGLRLSPESGNYRLTLPAAWLNAHPLSHANLVEEMSLWQAVGISLRLCAD